MSSSITVHIHVQPYDILYGFCCILERPLIYGFSLQKYFFPFFLVALIFGSEIFLHDLVSTSWLPVFPQSEFEPKFESHGAF